MNRQQSLQKYSTILTEYIEKVRRNIPKQYPSFKDFLTKMLDLLKFETQPKLGSQLVIFRLTINMRQPKLTIASLTTLSKLVSMGFIDGRTEDTSQEYYTEEFAELFNDSNYNKGEKKSVMDSLINCVTQCFIDKDEIIIQALKLLVAFVLNPYCNINSQNLTKIIKTIIYAYTRSRSQNVDRNAKNMLIMIINFTFQAIEGEVFVIQRNRRKMSIKEDSVQKLTQLIMTQLVDMVSLGMNNMNQLNNLEAINEKGENAGLFGFCIMCRKTAHLQCKDYKVPVCSYFCKRQHQEFVEQIQNNYNGAIRQYRDNLECALLLYESLCKLLSNKTTLQMAKNQQIILECLLYILETPDFTLSKNDKFIKITKECLCNQLLKYCLDTEKILYQYSFRIFQSLARILRQNLKHEMAIFINQIYLNILISANSSFYHKQAALESLATIFERYKTALEFYINYDCHTKHECLLLKIVEMLNNIVVQSVYQKQEYQIQQSQELILKYFAIKVLELIISGLNKTFDKYIINISEDQRFQMEEDNNTTINTTTLNMNPIEVQRQIKQEMMKGSQIFKKNPEKGITYLIEAGILNNDSTEIAHFLRESTQIGKEAIGQYLGGHQKMNIQVLSEYTDLLNFKNLTVEQALRFFLDQFTLPGESQQVDRIVQKFSHRYIQENGNSTFKSSDAVYAFSYLLVMLQTDLHNPQVVNKMKLSDFQKLAKSINEGEDLPTDYLTQTYQSIQKEPLAVREQEKARLFLNESLTQSIRKKQDLFQREKEYLLKQGCQLIKASSDSSYTVINSDMAYLIKPLLESIGKLTFDIFINAFNQEGIDSLSQNCIGNLLLFIKLCSYFSIQLEDYINQLIVATRLSQLNLITNKNIQLIKQILQTIAQIGNGLKESSWKSILSMISRLDEMRMIQQTKDNGDVQIIGVLPELLLDSELVDRVFVLSRNLDNEAIQEFINALCFVSRLEVFQSTPRTFCLQKLVEVCDHNMQRVNFIWTKIWNIVKDHITQIAIKEQKVAMFTVDLLKQLNLKFLQKEELYNFSFQREVLKPFEIIYISSELVIKEFIIQCINNLVQIHKSTIKSGWKVIINIINMSLKEDNQKINQSSFQILNSIMQNNLQNGFSIDSLQDVFSDILQTFKILATKNQEEYCIAAINFANQYLDYLSQKAFIIPKINWEEDVPEASVRNALTIGSLETYWIPLLGVLSEMAADKRINVQGKSIDVLFQMLQQFGYAFNTEFWMMVFRSVLRPLFEEMQFTFYQNLSNAEWFKESCKKCFSLIINLLKRYYQKLNGLLPEFLKLFESCIQNSNVKLAKYSILAVKNMVMKLGEIFNNEEWEIIIIFIDKIIRTSNPKKLHQQFNQELTPLRKKNFQEECFSKFTCQLLIIQITIDILNKFNNKLLLKQFEFLEQAFIYSFEFAKKFNQQMDNRFTMWKNGMISDQKHLPGLLKQERDAYGCLILINKYKLINFNIVDLQVIINPINQFIEKNQEYIINKKQNIDQQNNLQFEELKLQEIQREIQNQKYLLDQYILPYLNQLNDEQVIIKRDQFFDLFLKLTMYVNDLNCCQDCKKCEKCTQIEQLNLNQKVLTFLKKLYELK